MNATVAASDRSERTRSAWGPRGRDLGRCFFFSGGRLFRGRTSVAQSCTIMVGIPALGGVSAAGRPFRAFSGHLRHTAVRRCPICRWAQQPSAEPLCSGGAMQILWILCSCFHRNYLGHRHDWGASQSDSGTARQNPDPALSTQPGAPHPPPPPRPHLTGVSHSELLRRTRRAVTWVCRRRSALTP